MAALAALALVAIGGDAHAQGGAGPDRYDPFKPLGAQRPFLLAQAPPAPTPAPPTKPAPAPAGQPAAAPAPAAQGAPASGTTPKGAAVAKPAATTKPVSADEAAASSEPPAECTADTTCPPYQFCSERLGKCVERKQAINALGIFYLSSDRNFWELLGIVWHQRGRLPAANYDIVFPVYWRFWSARSRALTLFPLIGTERHPTGSTTWVLPLNFFWRRKDQSRFLTLTPPIYVAVGKRSSTFFSIAPPALLVRRGDERYGSAPFPLLWVSGDKEGTTGVWLLPPIYYGTLAPPTPKKGQLPAKWGWKFGIVPVFFAEKTDAASFGVLFPFVWHFSTPERATNSSFLLFWYTRRQHGETAGIFPFTFYVHDYKAQTKSLTILPLAWWREYKQEDLSHFQVLNFYHRKQEGRTLNLFFPLAWHYSDPAGGRYSGAVFPYFYHSDPTQRADVLFPLFWRFHEHKTKRTLTLAFPFFYRYEKEGVARTAVLGIYATRYADGWGGGLIPLFFFGRNGPKRHAVVFPLFWHFSNETDGTSRTVGFPLVWGSSDRRGWQLSVLPIGYFGKNETTSWNVVFPLIWNIKDRTSNLNVWAVGPFYGTGSNHGFTFGLAPILHFGRRGPKRHEILFPLVWHNIDDERGVSNFQLLNFFDLRRFGRDGRTTERDVTFFPLAHYRRRGDEAHFVSPLAYWHGTSQGSTLLFPVGGRRVDHRRGVDQGFALTGFRFRNPAGVREGIFPLFYHRADYASQRSTWVTLPLTVWHRKGNVSAQVIFPVFWRFAEPGESIALLFPLYYRAHRHPSRGRSVDVLFPLYWRYRGPEPDRRTDVVGPFFNHKRKNGYAVGFAPFIVASESTKRRIVIGLPLVHWANRKEASATTLVPPLFLRTRNEGYAGGLAPIFFAGRDRHTSYQVLFPIFWRFVDREEGRDTAVLFPFLYRKNGRSRAGGLIPLMYFQHGGGETTAAVIPLFLWQNKKGTSEHGPEWRLWTLPFYKHSFQGGSNGYAAIYLWFSNGKRKIDALLPLVWRWREHPTGKKLDLVFPIFFSFRAPSEAGLSLFPVFWRFRGIERVGTVFFPLFVDLKHIGQTRSTIAFPFFLRHNDYYDKTITWLVPPSFYFQKRPDSQTALLLPIFWHWKEARKNITLLIPIVWSFNKADKGLTYVFPIVFHSRDDRELLTAVFPFVWYYRGERISPTRSAKTGKMVKDYVPFRKLYVVPFFNIWSENPQNVGWDILLGVLGYERIGRSRFLKIFYIETQLAAPKGSQTSWVGAGGAYSR